MRPCQEREEQICLAIDGALSENDEKELMEHLNHCHECRALYEALMDTQKELRELGETSAPEQLKTSVMTQIRQEKKKKIPLTYHQIRYIGAGLAACMILCFGLYQKMEQTKEGASTTVTNSVASGMERKAMPDDVSGAGVAMFAVPEQQTMLRIAHMPEAGMELLSGLEWEQDAEGWTICTITSEQMTQLCEILEHEGMDAELPTPPYSESCVVMWQTT